MTKEDFTKKWLIGHSVGQNDVSIALMMWDLDKVIEYAERGENLPEEGFICPCCDSDKTYKTNAYHCKRCATTTEV